MLYGTQCCGVREISGLSSHQGRPQDSMKKICVELPIEHMGVFNQPRMAILVFTADIRYNYGKEFCNFIRRNKLGHVNAYMLDIIIIQNTT